MYSIIAATSRPSGPGNHRSHSLLVCTGAFTLSFAGFIGLLLGGAALPATGLACLAGAGAATVWAQYRVKASEERLRAAVHDGQALDRANTDLRRFAMAVAHDLRAPLVSTRGMLDMAKETADAGELGEVIELLDRATSTAQRMDGIISGILDMSMGAELPESDLVDLSEVLATSLADVRPALDELGFEFRCDDALGLVRGDARCIQQVFDNLVGNAVKYVRPPMGSHAPIVAVRATRLRRSIRISLSDNGPGIPQSRREVILNGVQEQFRTLKSQGTTLRPASGANLGLGLPLAKRAMEQCGGTLAIQTSTMGGTEFVLEFEADPCVIPLQAPKSMPATLPSAVLEDHPSYSSRTMLTTG